MFSTAVCGAGGVPRHRRRLRIGRAFDSPARRHVGLRVGPRLSRVSLPVDLNAFDMTGLPITPTRIIDSHTMEIEAEDVIDLMYKMYGYPREWRPLRFRAKWK